MFPRAFLDGDVFSRNCTKYSLKATISSITIFLNSVIYHKTVTEMCFKTCLYTLMSRIPSLEKCIFLLGRWLVLKTQYVKNTICEK